MDIEQQLYALIKELYKDIENSTPIDGFSSPRDINLVTEVNKKAAILNKLQESMRIMIPYFKYTGEPENISS